MKNKRKKICVKPCFRVIKNRNGSTMAEMLITVALMGIVLTAVTTGSYALMQTYQKIVMKAEAMTLMSTLNSAIDGELKNISLLEPDIDCEKADETLYLDSFYSDLHGYRIGIRNGLLNDSTGQAVSLDTGSTDGFPAIVLKCNENQYLPLAPSASYTGKLAAYLVPWDTSESENGHYILYDEKHGFFSYRLHVIRRSEMGDALSGIFSGEAEEEILPVCTFYVELLTTVKKETSEETTL